jgi:amino acid adenylation domain-containing protein
MEIIEGFELSPQQKHLWRLQYSSPNLPYRARCTVQIKGKIEPNTLKAAIEQVISSHEILRTTFNCVPGMILPLQVIAPDCTFNFSEYDYTRIELEAQLNQMELLWNEYNQFPFDFSQNLLFHCALVTLSEKESVLLLNLPALYVDIKGLDNLVLKISNSYSACLKGEQLFDEILQYADISEWQNQLLNDEEQELILAKGYWREQNITDYLSIKLSFERQFSHEIGFEPRYLNFTVSPNQVKQISKLIQKKKVSIDLFFLVCWKILLWRITQQSEVFIGVSYEGRKYEELQNCIGLLARYLPLKSSFKEGLLFQDVLKQIQLELNSIDTWQEQFTWESIIDENKSYIDTAFIPFCFEFTKLDRHIVDDICFSIAKHDICFDKFKVKLSLTQNQYDLAAQLYYDAKLFDEDYIQCLAEQFQTLLSSILDYPETVIDKIGILSDVEREKILLQFNDTSYNYPKDKCIHELFEEQVEKTPDAVAVVFEKQQLTYLQLNQKANQLAHYLQSLGVGPEELVGICVERSIEMVVGLLGILKAGGAYVPLDPMYPQQRLSYMLADSQLPILLTQQHLFKQLPQHQTQTICLDEDWQNFADYSQDNPCGKVKSNNLAYIIYTSGSTGQPKGTMILHSGMVNYLSWCTKAYNVADGVGSTVNSSIGFDATITSLFSPLLVGGKVVLLPSEGEIEALKTALCSGTKFSLVKITPAHLEILSHLLAYEQINIQTQAFIIGGEALSEKVTSFWQKHAPATRLINEYGPTETVVGCCIYEVGKLCFSGGNIPIGRPIANTQIYILDKHLQPVPIGVPGELYIGGDGLARGYLNRPELTQEKFIQNPFSNFKSERLYKTSDLARYLSDGNIEFLGRIDNQVKVRGFRIEPGEIEFLLTTHPQIQRAVVIATEDIPGNKRLIAYVVTCDKSLTTDQIREFLKHKLPEYMVPSAFVTLDTLPLTPNGKVDQKALPEPDGEITRKGEYIAPRTTIELQLTQIWSEVLNLISVGVQDNFFELGGHSLLAVRLMSQIQQHFQINLPLATLFQNPTIEKLAVVLGSSSYREFWSPLVPIQPNGALPPFFCVGGAGGNVLYFHHLATYLGKDQPFYGIQAQGLDGETKPLQSIEEIACHYIKAIQTVQPVGPYFLGGHSFGGKVAFEMAQQLQRQGQSVANVAILDTSAPISELNLKIDVSNWDNARWICEIAVSVEELSGENLQISYEVLAFLTPEKQLNYFKQQLEMVAVLPPQADIKLVRGFLQVYQTECQLDYVPHNTSPTPITLFRAQEINSQQENSSHLFQDPAYGWNQFSDGEVEIHTVPGNHISMMTEPHVKVLAQKLQKSLEQAQNLLGERQRACDSMWVNHGNQSVNNPTNQI